MRSVQLTLVGALLLLAQSASARVIWDWDFVSPYNEVGQRDTVVMNARIAVAPGSPHAFRWDGMRGWAYAVIRPFRKAYDFTFGPQGGLSFFDQFRGVTIAPGESFDFIFGVLTPKNGVARVGSYISPYQGIYLRGVGGRHQHYFQVDVPEPASWVLLALGLLMLPVLARRRKAGHAGL